MEESIPRIPVDREANVLPMENRILIRESSAVPDVKQGNTDLLLFLVQFVKRMTLAKYPREKWISALESSLNMKRAGSCFGWLI